MATQALRPRTATDYTVACICPMGVELAPVEAMLDEKHDPLPLSRDFNAYSLGRLGVHNMVIAVMPEIGNNAAAGVATQLLNDFPAIRFTFLVGIGGGVPGAKDIRLGDVVVGQATNTSGGVVQYDLGKVVNKGHFRRTGLLNNPPHVLSAHVRKLEGHHLQNGHQLLHILSDMMQRHPHMQDKYGYPLQARDDLFQSYYSHYLDAATCDRCDPKELVARTNRPDNRPHIHYGTIGSANTVVKDANTRDHLQRDMDLICVEMEAAGLVNSFPCLVIRGICDYADSHKNKQWQLYAAAVAAAYMKELLISIPLLETTYVQKKMGAPANEHYNKHFEVSHLLSPLFTGQKDICQRLENSFMSKPELYSPVQKRFVIYGLGGSGKTQVALWYTQTYREKYWAVFWVDASNIASIQRSFDQIASLLQIESDIEHVKRTLTNKTQPWLLVLDNADDPKLSLSKYFPPGDRGDLIITSRNPGCRVYSTVGHYELGSMQKSDSLALLSKIIQSDSRSLDEDEKRREHEITATLGHHALAITQAGAYIRETMCTLDDYLELYCRRRKEALEHEPQHDGTTYRQTVYSTWQVSLESIKSMPDDTSIYAIKILQLVCFFHHDQIPLAIFERAWENSHNVSESTAIQVIWPKSISNAFDLRVTVQAAVARLASYSLISRNGSTSFSIHPLVRDWCQVQLEEPNRRSACRQAVLLLAASVNIEQYTGDTMGYRKSLISHIHAVLQAYSATCGQVDDEDGTGHWIKLADILVENGFFVDALKLDRQIVQLLKSKLSVDYRHLLNSMCTLANHYRDAGRLQEALKVIEEVVQLNKDSLSSHLYGTMCGTYYLASLCSAMGRRQEALKLRNLVLGLPEDILRMNHPIRLRMMHGTALDYFELGRMQEALDLEKQVVQWRKTDLGVDHPDTINSMCMLAMIYTAEGRHRQATGLFEQTVQLNKGKLGDSHPQTIYSMQCLAISYIEGGQMQKSLELTEQIVQAMTDQVGTEHPKTIESLFGQALIYEKAGRRQEALEVGKQAEHLSVNILGASHPITLRLQELLQWIAISESSET